MGMGSIIFLNTSSDLYGADRSLLRTVRAIKQSYKGLIIVCLPYDGPLVEELRKLKVDVRIFRLAVMRRKYFTFFGVLNWFFAHFVAYFKLLKIAKTTKAQLIHSNTSTVFVGGLVARTLRVPHLWHLREIIIEPVIVRKFIAFLYLKLATRVIGVSESTIDYLCRDSKSLRSRSIVINNGIDLSDYDFEIVNSLKKEISIPDDAVLVGMIARVSFWKGQDVFLEMANEVAHKNNRIYFLALGSAFQGQESLMYNFREKVVSLKLGNRFIIHEFSKDIPKYLRGFDIFILPSKNPDPFPTTVLEAMMARKAIVANGHGGVLDMIEDGNEGCIIPPNDISEMSKSVLKLAESPDERTRMGENARRKLDNHFTFQHYERKITALFSEYIEGFDS